MHCITTPLSLSLARCLILSRVGQHYGEDEKNTPSDGVQQTPSMVLPGSTRNDDDEDGVTKKTQHEQTTMLHRFQNESLRTKAINTFVVCACKVAVCWRARREKNAPRDNHAHQYMQHARVRSPLNANRWQMAYFIENRCGCPVRRPALPGT